MLVWPSHSTRPALTWPPPPPPKFQTTGPIQKTPNEVSIPKEMSNALVLSTSRFEFVTICSSCDSYERCLSFCFDVTVCLASRKSLTFAYFSLLQNASDQQKNRVSDAKFNSLSSDIGQKEIGIFWVAEVCEVKTPG